MTKYYKVNETIYIWNEEYMRFLNEEWRGWLFFPGSHGEIDIWIKETGAREIKEEELVLLL